MEIVVGLKVNQLKSYKPPLLFFDQILKYETKLHIKQARHFETKSETVVMNFTYICNL